MSAKRKIDLAQPERTCVVCRKRSEKRNFLRFVCRDQVVIWDESQSAPGRGAYVHESPHCCGRLAESKLWNYAFRLKGAPLATDALQEMAKRVLQYVTRIKI